jgi:zinc/manganese transport system permease protein
MLIADTFGSPAITWNVVEDVRLVLQYPYMQHAFVASAVVAIMTGVVGWFMVLRSQAYAGHTLSVIGFPGAAGAALVGLSPFLGFFAFCIGGAVTIAWLAPAGRDAPGQSAAVGSVQAFALALGLLFASLYHGFLGSITTFLFGSFTGITRTDVVVLTVTSSVAVFAVVLLGRRLLFASVDRDVAEAAGVRVRAISVMFLIILGLAVAETSQFTGALLVFALLVAPAAAAQQLTARPGRGIALAIVLGVVVAWLGLFVAYFTTYPVGFFITTFAFVIYLIARASNAVSNRANT